MHHQGITFEDCWNIYTWLTLLTSWPFAYWMGRTPKLTDEMRWDIARDIVQQPVVMPDGRLQKAELVWKTYEPATPETSTASPRPATIVHGGARA